MTDENQNLYCLLAEFDNPETLLDAAHQARAAGYLNLDAYTPFPVEGLAEAIGFKRNDVALIVLLGGIAGGLGGYFMEWFANVISFPINIGGRPLNSWPAFIPITFELTILSASLCAVIGMLALNGLPMPYHPVFSAPRFDLASQERFFLSILATDPLFDRTATEELLTRLGAKEVSAVPDDQERKGPIHC
jgi:hypothetical protein